MAGNDELSTNPVQAYAALKGIPMDILVAAPLTAAGNANQALAETLARFVTTVGFLPDGTSARILTFNLTRPLFNPAATADSTSGSLPQWTTQTIQVNVPLLAIIPIPQLLIDTIDINFSTTIHQSDATTSSVSTSADAHGGVGWGPFSVSFSGELKTNRENTRKSDYTVSYNFEIKASQQEPTEGMHKLVDVFASCIVPLPVSSAPTTAQLPAGDSGAGGTGSTGAGGAGSTGAGGAGSTGAEGTGSTPRA